MLFLYKSLCLYIANNRVIRKEGQHPPSWLSLYYYWLSLITESEGSTKRLFLKLCFFLASPPTVALHTQKKTAEKKRPYPANRFCLFFVCLVPPGSVYIRRCTATLVIHVTVHVTVHDTIHITVHVTFHVTVYATVYSTVYATFAS